MNNPPTQVPPAGAQDNNNAPISDDIGVDDNNSSQHGRYQMPSPAGGAEMTGGGAPGDAAEMQTTVVPFAVHNDDNSGVVFAAGVGAPDVPMEQAPLPLYEYDPNNEPMDTVPAEMLAGPSVAASPQSSPPPSAGDSLTLYAEDTLAAGAAQQQQPPDYADPDAYNPDAYDPATAAFDASDTSDPGVHIEYESVRELVDDFRQCMLADPQNVNVGVQYLYDSLIDEMILGLAFEVHYGWRTGIAPALEGEPEDPKRFALVRGGPDVDVFGASCAKIQKDVIGKMECTCPKCDRAVAASKFAPHLEKCMGMGRNSSRIASRRLASTRDGGASNYFGGVQSDDDADDADWAGEKRKKKIQPVRTNGGKKNGKAAS